MDLHSKKDSMSYNNLVAKISNNYKMLAYEIKILKKIHNKYLKSSDLPHLVDYGIIQLKNVHDSDKSEESKTEDSKNPVLTAYYVIPRY